MKISEVVEKYILIRDRRASRKKEFEAEDAADKELQEKIEAKLLQAFDQTGVDSCRTAFGTAYKSSRTTASVADKESFMSFVREAGEWPLLEVRAAKTAVEQYKAEHGDLPPGVSWSEMTTINVRRT